MIKLAVFILIVGYFFYKNYKKTHNTSFPPWPAKCPDHWAVTKQGCYNKKK